uniref:Photosystem II subunit X n=1 Tax=Florenciella parvula TaxID=236787 RepID=A0A516Z9W3_9STRA|nr:photosystem II subunit X [Florenciella parvula]QDR24507.1 photosystem II subunit X [Florenciella parvula]
MTPSLVNFVLSLCAGFFIVIVPISAALIWVSSNDQLLRD